jgi:HoxN/HupN/NixA family high-affinity nickel-transporter
VGTLVSALFLFGIATVNLIVLRSIYQAFRGIRRGEPYVEEDSDLLLGSRGFLSRLFRPVFNIIRRSWHMYPLGILFGLGDRDWIVGDICYRSLKGLVSLVNPCIFYAFCWGDVAGR